MPPSSRKRAFELLADRLPDGELRRLRGADSLELCVALLREETGLRGQPLTDLLFELIVPELLDPVEHVLDRECLLLRADLVAASVAARLIVFSLNGAAPASSRRIAPRVIAEAVDTARTDPRFALYPLESGQSDEERRNAILCEYLNGASPLARRVLWMVLVDAVAIDEVARRTATTSDHVESLLEEFVAFAAALERDTEAGPSNRSAFDDSEFWQWMEQGGDDDDSGRSPVPSGVPTGTARYAARRRAR